MALPKPKGPLWTLMEAQALFQEIEPPIRKMEWHTMLGGGVLHRGSSDKDVDIFIAPLNGHTPAWRELYRLLDMVFGTLHAIRDSPDYAAGDPWYWSEMYSGAYQAWASGPPARGGATSGGANLLSTYRAYINNTVRSFLGRQASEDQKHLVDEFLLRFGYLDDNAFNWLSDRFILTRLVP